jgi:hypothetical protein
LPDISTTAPLAAFSAGQAAIVSRRAPCSFSASRLPLRVGHLEQIDLRHRAGDVEQRVDAAEGGQRLIDDGLRGRGSARSRSMTSGFAPAALTASAVSRDWRGCARPGPSRKNRARDGWRWPADALAGAGDDGD